MFPKRNKGNDTIDLESLYEAKNRLGNFVV